MKQLVKICLAVALAATPVAAQQTPPPTTPPVTQPVPAAPAQTTPPPGRGQGRGMPPPTTTPPTLPPPGQAPGQNQPRPEPPSSWQNVKIDIVVVDSSTPEPQNRKSVSMLVLDGRSGAVRSSAAPNSNINVDASPTIRPDGRIYLRVTFEYRIDVSGQQQQQPPNAYNINFSESFYLIVPDGRPVTASQAADPRSDRKVTVEITATVQK